MEIPEEDLVKLASETADFVQRSAARIEELESSLEQHKELLAKKSAHPEEKVQLVKIAMDQSEVAKVVDGLVKIGFVEDKEREQVVQRYMQDPREVLDLAASFVLPLAGDSPVGAGQHFDKQASAEHPDRGPASQRPDRSVADILRSVKRETSENR